MSIPTKLLATGVACAAAVLVCGTAATVVVATDVTGQLARQPKNRQAAASRPVTSGAFRDTGATARALDSLVAPLGPVTTLDTEDKARLAALSAGGEQKAAWVRISDSLPAPVPVRLVWRTNTRLTLDSLTAEERARLPVALADPWLPLFRTFARSTPSPAFFHYRSGLPDVVDARALPVRSFGAWRTLFVENELASLDALERGHGAEALARARENVAAARHFSEQPILLESLIGRVLLQRALLVLGHVAQAEGDTATASRAQTLYVESRNSPPTSMAWLSREESNPDSRAGVTWAADTALHPALRMASLDYIALSGCHNLREVVFGFSEQRVTSMRDAIAALGDIDRSAEFGALYEKFLTHLMTLREPPIADAHNSIFSRSEMLSAFSWIVPPGVRARAAMCLEQGL